MPEIKLPILSDRELPRGLRAVAQAQLSDDREEANKQLLEILRQIKDEMEEQSERNPLLLSYVKEWWQAFWRTRVGEYNEWNQTDQTDDGGTKAES